MMHRLEFHAMGSKMLAIVDIQDESPPSILEEVPAWFEEWEQVLSRFRSDSELSQLNLKAGEAIGVSQVLWDVFEASKAAGELTGGLVNPLILDALVYAGYDRDFDDLKKDSPRTIEDPMDAFFESAGAPIFSVHDIPADEARHRIRLPRASRLDFGGVAKGWSAHQAVERLKMVGPALVAAGGDIAVSGPQLDGEPWPISVADPFQDGQYLEMLYLDAGGVATSGRDYHRWTRAGIPQHHIIDPRTGLPAETDILAATVIAPSLPQAEALAKAVLISGSQAGLDWLDDDERWDGLLVLANGERLYSRNLGKYL